MLGGYLREIEDEEFGERGGEGSRQAGERGAGPLELIGLDKEWGGREGRYQFYQLLPTAPIIVIPGRANSADRPIQRISGPTWFFLIQRSDRYNRETWIERQCNVPRIVHGICKRVFSLNIHCHIFQQRQLHFLLLHECVHCVSC